MNTVLVDIEEKDLINFTILSTFNLKMYDEKGHLDLFGQYPFKLYRMRQNNFHFVTVQIPLENYCLFLGSGLVK